MEYSSVNNFRDYQRSAQKFGRFLFQCICMRGRFDNDHFSGPWRGHLDYKFEKVRKCSGSSTALGNWPCGCTCQKTAGVSSTYMLILTVSIDFVTRLRLPNEMRRICHFSLIMRLFTSSKSDDRGLSYARRSFHRSRAKLSDWSGTTVGASHVVALRYCHAPAPIRLAVLHSDAKCTEYSALKWLLIFWTKLIFRLPRCMTAHSGP